MRNVFIHVFNRNFYRNGFVIWIKTLFFYIDKKRFCQFDKKKLFISMKFLILQNEEVFLRFVTITQNHQYIDSLAVVHHCDILCNIVDGSYE